MTWRPDPVGRTCTPNVQCMFGAGIWGSYAQPSHVHARKGNRARATGRCPSAGGPSRRRGAPRPAPPPARGDARWCSLFARVQVRVYGSGCTHVLGRPSGRRGTSNNNRQPSFASGWTSRLRLGPRPRGRRTVHRAVAVVASGPADASQRAAAREGHLPGGALCGHGLQRQRLPLRRPPGAVAPIARTRKLEPSREASGRLALPLPLPDTLRGGRTGTRCTSGGLASCTRAGRLHDGPTGSGRWSCTAPPGATSDAVTDRDEPRGDLSAVERRCAPDPTMDTNPTPNARHSRPVARFRGHRIPTLTVESALPARRVRTRRRRRPARSGRCAW